MRSGLGDVPPLRLRLCLKKRCLCGGSLALSSSSCHSRCSQVLAGCGGNLLGAAKLGEDVQRYYNPDVNEAQEHDCSWCELPRGSILCKECKLVSLVLRSTLLTGKPVGFVGSFRPR